MGTRFCHSEFFSKQTQKKEIKDRFLPKERIESSNTSRILLLLCLIDFYIEKVEAKILKL